MQKRIWINYLLIILLAEKIAQHTFVSLAFLYDIGGIRSTVAVDYRALMISGAALAILFAVALPAIVQRKRWSLRTNMNINDNYARERTAVSHLHLSSFLS